MTVSQDGYVSFRGALRRDFGTIERASPLVFADVDGDEPGVLRRMPATFANQYDGLLLVRGRSVKGPDDEFIKKLRVLTERMTLGLRVCVLRQPVGEQPRIESLDGDPVEEESDYLARARAIELEALLDFGHAIWRPKNYHYRLITGEHAGAYIKLGDAIREPRDADLIASWLHPSIGPEVGLVLDTGTLTPVAQSLRLALAEAGQGPMGHVAVLDHHPRTGGDIDAALDAASGSHGRVVVIVSISSSGSLLERVRGAIQRKGSSMDTRVEVLVDKLQHPIADESVDVWTPLPGQKPLVDVGARDDIGCLLCRDPSKAVVIPINPFSFDAMLPTQLKRLVPDTQDPLANRLFWEAAKRTKAVGVERAAHAAIRRHRSDKLPMGIKFSMDQAITDAGLREALIERVKKLQAEEELSSGADLVLVAEHEYKHGTFADFWKSVHPVIAPGVPDTTPFPPTGDFSADLIERVRQASNVLVFALGAVTGGSLQRALVGVQDARKGLPSFERHGLVVHARPASAREWETVENSYRHTGDKPHLHFAWKSLLPDRSPLREEGALIAKLDLSESSELTGDEMAFVEERLELCQREIRQDDEETASGEGEGAVRVLWGAVSEEDRLTPNSLYGQDLDAITTYVAVGSAMAAALAHPEAAVPELRVFDIAAMTRSYYDPIILSCFLRWVRPHEAFWGWTAAEAETTALHIIDRAEGKHRKLLVPEMLLAAAQGKLTADARKVVTKVAEQLRSEAEFASERAAIGVGLRLAASVDERQEASAVA
jgi:hypothetical protein